MCSRCKKRIAVVFVTKLENGQKVNEGICMKCAKELGLPVENMLGNVFDKFGISPDQLGDMEDDIVKFIEEQGGLPSENDDNEDAGAPAIDFPKLFRESGLIPSEPHEIKKKDSNEGGEKKQGKGNKKEEKNLKPKTFRYGHLYRQTACKAIPLPIPEPQQAPSVLLFLIASSTFTHPSSDIYTHQAKACFNLSTT